MQVTEISAQGLRREYKVVLPAADLASRLEGELVGLNSKVRLNGFRPGKVPIAHLKRLYGRSVMSEIVQNAVNEANRQIVEDHGLRLALEPKVDLASDEAEVERAMDAKGDLAFTIAVETVPVFSTGSFRDLEIERQVSPVTEEDIDDAISHMAERNRIYEPRNNAGAYAEKGDRLIIDFTGRIDGATFERGSGEDIGVVLGSGSFMPGFEDQLLGAHIGEQRQVTITLPDNYLSPKLAGREAVFDVTVKAIALPLPLPIDDAFASGFGFETVAAMRDAVRGRLQGEIDEASRQHLKRALMDALDRRYDFDLPETLVAQEFDKIWAQAEAELKASGRSFEDAKTTEAEARAEYRRIAARRIRLGLVLAQVSDGAGIKVDDNEVGRALAEVARRYPGREKEVWEAYAKYPQALNELRAPLLEDKVVDFIVAQARIVDRLVSRQDLFKPDSADLPVTPTPAVPHDEAPEVAAPEVAAASEPQHEAPGHDVPQPEEHAHDEPQPQGEAQSESPPSA